MENKSKEIIAREIPSQLVVFKVQKDEFAIPIEEIQEIIMVNNITAVPDAPKFVEGVINVRGDIVTIIDMKKCLHLSGQHEGAYRHIIITEQNAMLFGLLSDEVVEILRVTQEGIKTSTNFMTKINKEYVKGVVVQNDRLIILLQLSKLLCMKEKMSVAKVQR